MTACRECGTEMVKAGSGTRYCSDSCRKARDNRVRRVEARTIPCEACGIAMVARRNTKRWCSPACRYRLLRPKPKPIPQTCERCGTGFSRTFRAKFCSPTCKAMAHRKHHARPCEQCGNEFWRKRLSQRKDAQRFCSRTCSFEYAGFVKIAIRATKLLERARKPRRTPRPQVECPTCKKKFVRYSVTRAYCSKACKPVPPKKERVAAPRDTHCRTCGVEIVGLGRFFCSDRCSKKLEKKIRRARKLSAGPHEAVGLAYVMKRDAGKCRLCGGAVDRNAVVPHPKAPTLDHVVPLSRGGTHTRANLQLAHFSCNVIKGDRAMGEQLMLVG